MRMHLYRPITDAQGNLRIGATVRLIDPDTDASSTVNIFSTEDGTDTLENPFVADDGIVDVWFDDPLVFDIGVVPVNGVTETVVNGIYPDGVSAALALRTTDCVIFYTDTQPLRSTGTTDVLRRVRWSGPFKPVTTTGYAIDGFDIWEQTP